MGQWVTSENEEVLMETSNLYVQKSADGKRHVIMAIPIRSDVKYIHDICIKTFDKQQEAKYYLSQLFRQFQRD